MGPTKKTRKTRRRRSKSRGSSLLPVALIRGQVHCLFGKERAIDDHPGWSDFGGGVDAGETWAQAAAREGSEESTGFLGTPSELQRRLAAAAKSEPLFHLDYTSEKGTYRVHLLPMAYDPALAEYYNRNQRFLQRRLDAKVRRDSKIFEKTEVRWWSWAEMRRGRSQFRVFYRHIVDRLLAQQEEIEAYVRRHLNDGE